MSPQAVRERGPDDLRAVATDLVFPESFRWHEDELWFSDIRAGVVRRLDIDTGAVETVVAVAGDPSGLGWDADGRLLVVSMEDRQLMRLDDDGQLSTVASLAEFAPSKCNDMIVSATGDAYIGHFGFDPENEQPRSASLIRVAADGSVSIAAAPVEFPNGTVITPDGRTLIVAESWSHELTAFDIAADGGLENRRTWADIDGAAPDGICLDAEGAIWMASPISKEVLRIAEGGDVLERIRTGDQRAITCGLGGADRSTLLISTVGRAREMESGNTGRILAAAVSTPGAGLP